MRCEARGVRSSVASSTVVERCCSSNLERWVRHQVVGIVFQGLGRQVRPHVVDRGSRQCFGPFGLAWQFCGVDDRLLGVVGRPRAA
ncbi:hypothetical protein B296_00005097 [Ensete ventricosum]|uniref:Uncharacterized protein n=1 Tax=Ensete ventricosum TaxID=4639 RepID=A0A427AZU3_ENSVE|nr:hypothetical protein B296_00005097 [Ensete ventricosum]